MQRRRVDIVELSWWVHAGFDAAKTARTWLRLARRHLPEAVPRRYDVIEPSRFAIGDSGDDGFAAFPQSADDAVHFSTKQPTVGGHLADPSRRRGRFREHALTLLADSLEDVSTRAAVRTFFLHFAVECEAIIATGELLRDWHWNGRSIGYIVRVSEVGHHLGRDEWLGLPPDPLWWTWFGPAYVPLVRDHLDPARCEAFGAGLFHYSSPHPANRDQLRAQHPNTTWLPAELLLIPDDAPLFTAESRPDTPAQVRPATLA